MVLEQQAAQGSQWQAIRSVADKFGRKVERLMRQFGPRYVSYVAFVTDIFSRRLVGWRARTALRTDRAFDAPEQSGHRRPTDPMMRTTTPSPKR